MDFNEWYESMNDLPRIQNYHKNIMEYFVHLKRTFVELKINEGIEQLYVKKNNLDEITNFYFFYENKVTIVTLDSIVIIMENLYFSDLNKIVFLCELDSRYTKKLILNFNGSEITLEPEVDADYDLTELDDYNENLTKIYRLVK